MQVTPTASCGGTCSPPSRCSWRSSCQLSPYYCYCPELVWELLPSLEWPELQPEHGEGSWLQIGEPSEPRREHRSPWLRGEAWPEHLVLDQLWHCCTYSRVRWYASGCISTLLFAASDLLPSALAPAWPLCWLGMGYMLWLGVAVPVLGDTPFPQLLACWPFQLCADWSMPLLFHCICCCWVQF